MCTDIIENVIKFHQDSEPRKPKSIKKPLDIVCQLEVSDSSSIIIMENQFQVI